MDLIKVSMTVCVLFFITNIQAQPSRIIERTQPNGTVIKLNIVGNFQFRFLETLDGYTVQQSKDKTYCYAVNSFLGHVASSGRTAHNSASRTTEEVAYIKTLKQKIRHKGLVLEIKRLMAASGPQ